MADLATLGLRVDATGALVPLERTRQAFNSLGQSAFSVEGRIKGFATNTAFAISSMASGATQDITGVLKSFSSLGFAFGTTAGIAALAVSSIADAFSETRRRAKAEQDSILADLQKFVGDYTAQMLRIQIAAKEARVAQLSGMGEEGLSPLQKFGRQALRGFLTPLGQDLASPFAGEIQRTNDELAKLNLRLADIGRDRSAKQLADDLRDAASAARELSDEALKRFDADFDMTMKRAFDAAKRGEQEDKDRFEEQDRFASDTVAFGIAQAVTALDKYVEAMKKTEQQAKRTKEALIGIAVGGAAGLMSRAGPGGAVAGNAFQAGVAGFGAAGPWGAAAAGTFALVDGLLGLNDASKEARAETERLLAAHEAFTDQIKEQIGLMTPLEARLADVTRQFGAQRDALIGTTNSSEEWLDFLEKLPMADQRRIDAARELNALEAQMLTIVRERMAIDEAFAMEDLRVRQLLALGRNEEAEAMAQQLENERELEQARRDGRNATYLLELQETQRLEAIAREMEKVRTRIASLSGTIGGLESFRNSLLTSEESGLSDADRLKNARQQYLDVLFRAQGLDTRDAHIQSAMAGVVNGPFTMGGIQAILASLAGQGTLSVEQQQAAAAQLPGAAQILLELSRLVNASGGGFQADFQRVLSDTQRVIEHFMDLRSVEEEMLEQLKRLLENSDKAIQATQAVVDATAASAAAITAAVAEVGAAIGELTDQARRDGDGARER